MTSETLTSPAADARYESFMLASNDWVTNNAWFPVLIWRGAFDQRAPDVASRFETLFGRNGWAPQWRDSVFDYHHFHSTAHEALGVASGEAELILGRPNSRVIAVHTGDALVLPAGTGHCLLTSEGRFQVVGAYPLGQQWDIHQAQCLER